MHAGNKQDELIFSVKHNHTYSTIYDTIRPLSLKVGGGSSPSSPHVLPPMITVVVSVKLLQGMVNVRVVIVNKEIQSCVSHSIHIELCIYQGRRHIGTFHKM